jgi:hypothetical protein
LLVRPCATCRSSDRRAARGNVNPEPVAAELPDPKESGIFTALASPGQFTAIVAGKNGGIGIALVEI